MRLVRRTALGGALGVILGAVASPRLQAQLPVPDLRAQVPRVAAGVPWPTAVEGQLARMRVDGAGGERTAGGFGVRLVYGRRSLADADDDRPWLARHSEVAVFATHARQPRRDGDGRWTTVGVALDLRPLDTPIAGRLEPFVSLGAGLLRERESRWLMPASWRYPPMHDSRMRSGAALLPGAGLRMRVTRRVAVQAEARDVVSLRSPSRHGVLLGTGLRLGP